VHSSTAEAHALRCARAAAALRAQGDGGPVRVAKRGSNLFRDRDPAPRARLDLSDFTHVLEVSPAQGWVDCEGGTSYETLVDACLPQGVMPAVVPQLKTITAGGAVAGVGIEATSFRQGLVHHTMLALDVLLSDGRVVHAEPGNEHEDLFRGFANSYGTLGYVLRLRLRTLPVKPVVEVRHQRFSESQAFFDAMAAACDQADSDFVDGVVFGRDSFVLSIGRFVDSAPRLSDYGFERIYYRSLLERQMDHLSTHDYLWRWDTDWFWCSKNLGAQHPLLRRLYGRERLNSRTYTKLMRWNSRWGLTRMWSKLSGDHPESVIQDVDIPLPQADQFLQFLLREIGLLPIWICPLRETAAGPFTLYPLERDTSYLNFGFWDVVHSRIAHEPGHFNRLVEHAVMRLGGIKSLYSDSFFTEDQFAAAYHLEEHEALKARYDPEHRLLGLYEKCVLRR
jgi:FAD/FMN-containing dehydrogenase